MNTEIKRRREKAREGKMEKAVKAEEIKHETESKVRDGRKTQRVSKECSNVKDDV